MGRQPRKDQSKPPPTLLEDFIVGTIILLLPGLIALAGIAAIAGMAYVIVEVFK